MFCQIKNCQKEIAPGTEIVCVYCGFTMCIECYRPLFKQAVEQGRTLAACPKCKQLIDQKQKPTDDVQISL